MPFRPCPSGCGRFLSADDGHDRCLQCLGRRHAEAAFVDDSCVCCGRMSMISLRSRLSFMKGLAPSAATRADLSGSSRGSPADALGDLRVTVRASPPGTPPRTSYSSRSEHPVRFPGDFAGLSHGAPSISFGAPSVDRMSIAASGDGFTSSEDEGAVGLPPSGVVATAAPDPELTAMLARAAVSIGLEVNRPPSPEPSRLDDWFLGAGRGSQPHKFVDGPFHGQKPLVRLLRPHYPRWRSGQGVRGHSPGGESGRGALVPTKRRHLEEPSASPVQGL